MTAVEVRMLVAKDKEKPRESAGEQRATGGGGADVAATVRVWCRCGLRLPYMDIDASFLGASFPGGKCSCHTGVTPRVGFGSTANGNIVVMGDEPETKTGKRAKRKSKKE